MPRSGPWSGCTPRYESFAKQCINSGLRCRHWFVCCLLLWFLRLFLSLFFGIKKKCIYHPRQGVGRNIDPWNKNAHKTNQERRTRIVVAVATPYVIMKRDNILEEEGELPLFECNFQAQLPQSERECELQYWPIMPQWYSATMQKKMLLELCALFFCNRHPPPPRRSVADQTNFRVKKVIFRPAPSASGGGGGCTATMKGGATPNPNPQGVKNAPPLCP